MHVVSLGKNVSSPFLLGILVLLSREVQLESDLRHKRVKKPGINRFNSEMCGN